MTKYVLASICAGFMFMPFATKADVLSTATILEIITPPHGYIQVADDSAAMTEGAKTFIDSMGQRAIGFLSNDGLSKAQKQSKFRGLLKDSFDMQTIGRFALGKHWKTANPAQQKQYLKLFEEMVVEVYSARFDDYQGQNLDVRTSKAKGKRDSLVTSYIVDDAGQEFKVDWLVRHKNGRYKIVDVIIEGVSMSITQRSDFSSVIQRGGGDVEVLLAHLKQ